MNTETPAGNARRRRQLGMLAIVLLAAAAAAHFLWPAVRDSRRQAVLVWTAEGRSGCPMGPVAASRDGRAYAANRNRSEVWALDASGATQARWRIPNGARPYGLAVDAKGNVRVLASKPAGDCHILTYTPKGRLIGRVLCREGSCSLAIAPDGSSYTSPGGALLVKVEAGAGPSTMSDRTMLYDTLVGVWQDGSACFLLKGARPVPSSSASSTLQQFRSDGALGWRLAGVRRAGMSPGGALYVLPEKGRWVERYSASGRRTGRWRLDGATFSDGLAADGLGNVYTWEWAPGAGEKIAKYRLPGDRPDR